MDITRVFTFDEVVEVLGEDAATKLFEETEKDMRREAPIHLDFPVTMAGANVSTLTMRRPTAREEIAFSEGKGGTATRANTLLATLCGVAPADLMGLDSIDYEKVEQQFARFKGASSRRLS